MRETLARHWWAIWLAGLFMGARLVATLRAAERLARSGTWNIERDAAASRARAARVGLVLVSAVLVLTTTLAVLSGSRW